MRERQRDNETVESQTKGRNVLHTQRSEIIINDYLTPLRMQHIPSFCLAFDGLIVSLSLSHSVLIMLLAHRFDAARSEERRVGDARKYRAQRQHSPVGR